MSNRLSVLLLLLAAGLAEPSAAADGAPVVRDSRYVAVRDGTRLAVNVYRSAASVASGVKQPVVFVFTPYRARYRDERGAVVETALDDRLALRSLIDAGYAVAVADIRGKGASFGHRRGFQDRTEAEDGHDLVEWLARQPYASGKVGMLGCSYLGGTTFHTATTAPPALKAVFIGATDLDKYAFVRNGGITAQFNTRPDELPEVDLASVPVDGDADGSLLRAAVAEHAANTPMAALWYSMPYRDSVSPLTGNAFWREVAVYDRLEAIRGAGIATYFWGNWHDEPTGQVLLAAANLGGRFLAGPGDHCVPPPGFDFAGEVVRYFDHYLKGAANGFERQPRATYHIDGPDGGRYVRADSLPGTASRPLAWFLGGAGGGSLDAAPGADGGEAFRVDYDLPAAEYFAFWPGPMAGHGLGYASAPLAAPLTLVGFPVVHLAVRSSDPRADLFVYLDEVAADGAAKVIAFGRLKLSHAALSPAPYDALGLPWHSGLAADARLPAAGEEVALAIALTPVARTVPAGARLRLDVAGADPRQRNLSDLRIDPAPEITVLRGGTSASRIELPVAN